MNIPIGWLIAFTAAFGGFVWLGGEATQLWVPEEFLIIFGAAAGTLVASNKWRNLKNLIRSFGRIFVRAETNKTANLALLCLMFELLQKIKRDGSLSIEADITAPSTSALFAKYPAVLKHNRLLEFITDYFRMMMDGTVTLSQLETVMAQEIEVLNQESLEPSDSMITLSDSMPAFGIVAAIVGVIHTLASIKLGKSPGEIGASIASALTGTLLGVFSAYALFAPIARTLEQNAASDVKPFEAVKEILIAYYSNFSPLVAVEYGRKVLFTDQRPSMSELEAGVLSTSGTSLRG
ncbi:flagellar motor stator protein MotA [Limnohabitans sp. Hippo4]|uniref:flagellar motor stator protein MotA n=1 Tax=Limnohabitans sp. Hippo4 TaxID=1826167 RepID=UPI000D3550B1|nr:flagellar motor stator protein MotA [Limnohabitans sp. Hippo4]PUE37889.1 flagellar motor stator protein MotA [Limnohabitans sp. Hippo4]